MSEVVYAKSTKNPKMFTMGFETSNIIHLLQGRTKLEGTGMTVEEYYHNQEATNADNRQASEQPEEGHEQ